LTPLTRHFSLKNELASGVWSDWRYVMCMISQADKAQRFLELHRPGEPLLMPNPWDLGSAKLLASLGFAALATTSSGFAATLGRNDGSVTRDEAMIHAAVIVAATDLPVSADLENAYADDPAGAAWCSPPGRRTSSAATPISPTRSPGCRPTRRPAPTSCTRRACAVSRTSARWCARSTGRSTCSPWTTPRQWPNWPGPGWPGSRWAADSRSPPWARWLPPPPNYASREPTP